MIHTIVRTLIVLGLLAGQAQAATIYIQNVGGSVKVTGSGSIDLTNWKNTNSFNFGLSPYINGFHGFFSAGIINPGDIYEVSGPITFGTIDNNYFLTDNGDSDKFALGSSGAYIIAPDGATTVDFSSFDFSLSADPNASITDIGLTPGTYTYTTTFPGKTDTFDVQIIPEPGQVGLIMAMFAACVLAVRHVRNRR